jgi:hypothetical protein
VHLELHLTAARGVPQDALLPAHLVVVVHGRPLEGRVRLGHERGHAHRDLATVVAAGLGASLPRAVPRPDDALHVFVFLGGKADHEVELHLLPTAREHALGRLEQLLFRDVLVHHVAHALRARFGREREAAGALRLHVVQHVLAQAVGAQRAHAHVHALPLEGLHGLLHQRRDGAVVGGGQRRERGLVVAAVLHGRHDGVDDLLRPALAHGAVDHAGLAEAAALGAAARHLHGDPVEDGLGGGHGPAGREGILVQVRDERALHRVGRVGVTGLHHQEAGVRREHGLVERGHVQPAQLGQRHQALTARHASITQGRPGEHDLGQLGLAVADQEHVDERRDGLRVCGHGAARDDQRVGLPALVRPARDATQVQHLQDVGVGELELQREAHDVEVAQRPPRLEREQRHLVLAELRLHVGPHRVAALGQELRVRVDEPVQDLVAKVAHPDLVHVGEAEEDAAADRVPVLVDLAGLAAQVLGGALHLVEEGEVGVLATIHGSILLRWGVRAVNWRQGRKRSSQFRAWPSS